ncbi:MAG: hypothetical protein ACREOV_08100, partial [Candidatus Dormibacteraceae bacterium]
MIEPAVPAPGPGRWVRETTHQVRPYGTFYKAVFMPSFQSGMRRAFREYGVLLDRIEMREVRGWMYGRPRPVAAPEEPGKPPPRALFALLLLAHPELRRRRRAARRALVDRPWMEDARRWDAGLRDRFADRARELRWVVPANLGDEMLRQHLGAVLDFLREGLDVHFHHTVGHMVAVGDWAARTAEWTGVPPAVAVGALRGSSPWSLRPVETLDRLVDAVRSEPAAQQVLSGARPPARVLAALGTSSTEVAAALQAHLDEHGDDIVTGFQLDDRCLREIPSTLVAALRARLARAWPAPAADGDDRALALRARIPAAARPEYDRLLEEARLLYGLRDDDGRLTCARPFGLARRALLAAGERLRARGRLQEVDDIFQAGPEEVDGLLAGSESPAAEELGRRSRERMAQALDAPPEVLGDPEFSPPTEWLPPACARVNSAVMLALELADTPRGASGKSESRVELRGLPASGGCYEGIARIVCQP